MNDDQLVKLVGKAMRDSCLEEFGSCWSNDVSWKFARVAIAEVYKHVRVQKESTADAEVGCNCIPSSSPLPMEGVEKTSAFYRDRQCPPGKHITDEQVKNWRDQALEADHKYDYKAARIVALCDRLSDEKEHFLRDCAHRLASFLLQPQPSSPPKSTEGL